jgi:hypothetical protein
VEAYSASSWSTTKLVHAQHRRQEFAVRGIENVVVTMVYSRPLAPSLPLSTLRNGKRPSQILHCHRCIGPQQISISLVAVIAVAVASVCTRVEDVEIAATAIFLAFDRQGADPIVGALAEVLAGASFEWQAGTERVHGAVVVDSGVGCQAEEAEGGVVFDRVGGEGVDQSAEG